MILGCSRGLPSWRKCPLLNAAQVCDRCCPCISKPLPAIVATKVRSSGIRDLQLRWVGGSGAETWPKTLSSQCPVNMGQR